MNMLAAFIMIGAVCSGGAIGGIIGIYRGYQDAKKWLAKQEADEAAFIAANPTKPLPPRNQLI